MPSLVLLLGATTLLFLLQPFLASGFTSHHPPLQVSLLNKKQGSVPYPDSARTRFKSIHSRTTSTTSTSTSRLYALLDVPDNFFTILLPTLSLFLAFSKAVARSRLEERAWEQRLEESRLEQLERDFGQTEIELRKREAAAEWSAYGRNVNGEQQEQEEWNTRKRVVTRQQTKENASRGGSREYYSNGIMSPQEIEKFEREFGVQYDPYYDDPYTEEELPEDIPYKVEKLYGDRIYKDGEVFYKDDKTGLYYRQGSQPRTQKFWW
jgi:hypothetical protein